MKALRLKSFGGPEAFELCDVPEPVPDAGQVLVQVHATSINPLDYQVRRGDYVRGKIAIAIGPSTHLASAGPSTTELTLKERHDLRNRSAPRSQGEN